MAQMVMYVSNDLQRAEGVLEVWENEGARGVTIIETAGINRGPSPALRDDVGFIPSFASLLRGREIQHRTLFTVVSSQGEVDRLVEATTKFIGSDWSQPDVGLLLVVPVNQAYGMDTVPRQE